VICEDAPVKLHVLDLGRCDVDVGGVLTPGIGDGERALIPIPAYLLETDSGERVVIDTGMHLAHIDDPDHSFGGTDFGQLLRPVMTAQDTLPHRLGELGLSVDDVTHVVNTHLHFDHCGQNSLFTDATILVHRQHYEAALTDEAFPNENFDLPQLSYELFDGDRVELFDGVTTITTHGHAPFHQSLLIELAQSGPILLAVDAIYTRANLEQSAWGSQADPEAAAEGGALLAQIAADRGARLIFGHDLGQWHELARAPDGFYA
jgi:N-acyl homoserine lactone hydrolase